MSDRSGTPKRIVIGGCEVSLVGFGFSPSYDGWIEGYPNPSVNSGVRGFAIEKAKGMARSSDASVFVIEPDKRPIPASLLDGAPKDYEELPEYCCIGRFETIGEELLIVWFQDELPVRFGSGITSRLEALPWDKLATQFQNPYDDLS